MRCPSCLNYNLLVQEDKIPYDKLAISTNVLENTDDDYVLNTYLLKYTELPYFLLLYRYICVT